MNRLLPAASALLVLVASLPAQAQEARGGARRAAIDTVVAVGDYFGDAGMWQTQLVLDTSTSVELMPSLQATVRPLFWRTKDGTWKNYTPHVSLRYEFEARSNWRIEVGRFPSPVGLGMTENRPDVNPGVLWCHRPYYGDLPSFGDGSAPHALISANYPVGVHVSTSGDRWDARVAATDRAPVDLWTARDGTPRRLNVVAGAGVSPRQGVRIGVATARGRSGDHLSSVPYSLVNVEGELAFRHTRVSGEWTRDVFDTPSAGRVASGWTMQARQALTPRIFVHSRVSTVDAPLVRPGGGVDRLESFFADTTLGYLVTPEVTLRVGHAALKGWGAAAVDHQAGVSVVWAQRWW